MRTKARQRKENRKKLLGLMAATWFLGSILLPVDGVSLVDTGPGPGSDLGGSAPGRQIDPSSSPSVLEGGTWGGTPSAGSPVYDLDLRLEVTGNITLLSRTRYYRSEDLHFNLLATPAGQGWQLRALGPSAEQGALNFGIGEGPRKHQRYVLLASLPSEEEKRQLEQKILDEEAIRGCAVQRRQAQAVEDDGQGSGQRESKPKKAFFNYYLWKDPGGSFSFLWAPSGQITRIENRVELNEFAREGGSKVNPRFFETLEFVLSAIPSFLEKMPVIAGGTPYGSQWEMSCRPVLEGLVSFCEGVYERKMTLLEPEALDQQKAFYSARPVPNTSILRIQGFFSQPVRTGVRISGFKGEIWLESLLREVYYDTAANRILKDELDLSFGIERDKNILAISGNRNRVHVSLVDRCFMSCPDTDDAIRVAYRDCALSASSAGSCR